MPAIPERQALRQVVVDSLCLRDNPLGDPHVRRFPVYVPPQYDTEPERRFPVVWLLAGYAGWGEQKATAVRAWEDNKRHGILAVATGGGKTISAFVAAGF